MSEEIKQFLDRIQQRHEEHVRSHLRGEEVDWARLWLAVGYFENGPGRDYLNKERPFTKEEWRKLLKDTHRSEDDWYLNTGAKGNR